MYPSIVNMGNSLCYCFHQLLILQTSTTVAFLVNTKTKCAKYVFFSFFLGDTCQTLFYSFNNELSLKEKLMPEFKHCKNRDQLMVYLSLWLHEPLLDDDYEVLLESMLLEAELR